MALLLLALLGLLFALLVLLLRVWLVLRGRPGPRPGVRASASLMVVAGSGGHTTELLRLLSSLSWRYSPRHYVVAATDEISEEKIHTFEKAKCVGISDPLYFIHRIPRSREVRQSWSSSLLTTFYSLLYSLPLTARVRPDLVLCNGPGTCVPVCLCALLLGVLGIKRVTIIYVESVCRVETLSLSGRLLYYLSDYFIVQWPNLQHKYPKSIYLGRVV